MEFQPVSLLGSFSNNSAELGKWIYVIPRFRKFIENIAITPHQYADGITKTKGVIKLLNRAYWDIESERNNFFMVGSWGKKTLIRPPRDVDILFALPYSVYARFQARTGNIQSQLLNEVRQVLSQTYSTSHIRGDGQVVSINFTQNFGIEIVPVFNPISGGLIMPDTHNDGKYKNVTSLAECVEIDNRDNLYNGLVRHLVMMMKVWQTHCNVDIKSFHIDMMAQRFIIQWYDNSRTNHLYYYDWMCRDFFAFMLTQVYSGGFIANSTEYTSFGSKWLSKAQSAHSRAIKACEYESESNNGNAGLEWQKIFGNDIPMLG